jgi:hypothetical protein
MNILGSDTKDREFPDFKPQQGAGIFDPINKGHSRAKIEEIDAE